MKHHLPIGALLLVALSAASAQVATLKRSGGDASALIEATRLLGEQIKEADEQARAADEAEGVGERVVHAAWRDVEIRVRGVTRDARLRQIEAHPRVRFVVFEDAKSGAVLWKSPQRNQYAVHPNTPIVLDSMVFISSGYGYGSQLLKIGADGKSASQIWSEKQLDVHHEGVLMINGLLYGSRMPGRFVCMDPKDGKVLYTVAGVKKASIMFADGRIYAFDEKGGDVSLIEVSPTAGKVCGSFKVTEGSGAHWAHPVVANGVLYIRHGESLMAYDVKAK